MIPVPAVAVESSNAVTASRKEEHMGEIKNG